MTANKPAAFCEDTALSIAERTFSTEVDEQLASDIIQYAQRLHSLYAAPKREEQKEPDSLCVEDDGCPTERAVLQRFWRKHHQTAPDELSDYDRGFRDGKLDRLIDEVVAESKLVEALEAVMEFGCDPKSNRGGWALEKAESALEAYRKQGGGK